MKLRALAVLFGFALSVGQACAEDAAKIAELKPRLAYGLMMKQGDKLLFSPCRDRSYALLDDVSGDGSVLRGLDQVGLSAGRKLYVELLGVTDGVALKASALNLARTDGRCQQPGGAEESWQAAGKDWLLAAGGQQILIKRQGEADLQLPYREFSRDGQVARYAEKTDNFAVDLQFEPKLCNDPSADAVFGWTARLTINGKTLLGCAWQR